MQLQRWLSLAFATIIVSTSSAQGGEQKKLPEAPAATKNSPGAAESGQCGPASNDSHCKLLIVTGDFSKYLPGGTQQLSQTTARVIVSGKANEVIDPKATLESIEKGQATVFYHDNGTTPDSIYIGAAGELAEKFPVGTTSTSRVAVISGAFCTPSTLKICDEMGGKEAHITSDDGMIAVTGKVDKVDQDRMSLEFSAPPDFHPRLVTVLGEHPANFAFVPLRPRLTRQLVYQGFGLSALCLNLSDAECRDGLVLSSIDAPNATFEILAVNGESVFVTVTSEDGMEPYVISATAKQSPDPSNAQESPTSQAPPSPSSVGNRQGTPQKSGPDQSNSTVPSGQTGNLAESATPSADKGHGDTVLLRRVTEVGEDQSLLTIRMTTMDQETVRRDFGQRIAQHYIAVSLDVKNRTSKKLQFNKSAVWFDADYRAVSARTNWDVMSAGYTATAYTYFSANVYRDPAKRYDAKSIRECLKYSDYDYDDEGHRNPKHDGNGKDRLRLPTPDEQNDCLRTTYRFGIEQNARLSPMDYMTILAAFDYTTEKTDRALRFIELIGATLLPISSGTIVAQVHDTAFRDSVAIFTGTFLPAYRGLALDPASINRMRSNLVSQTMQETVQISPEGMASTILLVPRDGMLAFRGRNQPVVVDRLLNVHLDPDVINGTKDPLVPVDHVEVGYTIDQVRQSLGEPPNTSTDDTTGQLTYTYSKGPYKTVVFTKDGKVISWTDRSLDDQIAQRPTLADAISFLDKKSLSHNRISLTDGRSILTGIAGATKIPVYDTKDAYQGTYTLLYSQIQQIAAAHPLPSDFYAKVKAMHLGTAPYAQEITSPLAQGNEKLFTYPMPDITGGSLTAHVDSSGAVQNVTFTGPGAELSK